MFCGLLIGTQTAYLLRLYLALYAPLALALPALAITLPTHTRTFAHGLLAAAAAMATLITVYYLALSIPV